MAIYQSTHTGSQIDALEASITTEKSRAEAAEATLTSAVATEKTRAMAAEHEAILRMQGNSTNFDTADCNRRASFQTASEMSAWLDSLHGSHDAKDSMNYAVCHGFFHADLVGACLIGCNVVNSYADDVWTQIVFNGIVDSNGRVTPSETGHILKRVCRQGTWSAWQRDCQDLITRIEALENA